jgi:ABC-2 type transport system permease protein
LIAIYVLWLREVRRLLRARLRLVGTLLMPVAILAYFGLGLGRASLLSLPRGLAYGDFLLPGILGMSILFGSTVAGISVLWDREFGFLKEILVAPVSRLAIAIGRMAGGVTTSFVQALMIMGLAALMGFRPRSMLGFGAALVAIVLTSLGFVGLGLLLASMMREVQGFNLVMSFVVFPCFLLSGAFFPLSSFAPALRVLSYADPLMYGVDALRGSLVGVRELSLATDLAVLGAFAAGMAVLGGYSFEARDGV